MATAKERMEKLDQLLEAIKQCLNKTCQHHPPPGHMQPGNQIESAQHDHSAILAIEQPATQATGPRDEELALVPADFFNQGPAKIAWEQLKPRLEQTRTLRRMAFQYQDMVFTEFDRFMETFGEQATKLASEEKDYARLIAEVRTSDQAAKDCKAGLVQQRKAKLRENELRAQLHELQVKKEQELAALNQQLNETISVQRRAVAKIPPHLQPANQTPRQPAANSDKATHFCYKCGEPNVSSPAECPRKATHFQQVCLYCIKCGRADVNRARECPNRTNHYDFTYRY